MWDNTLTEIIIMKHLKNPNQASYQIEYWEFIYFSIE